MIRVLVLYPRTEDSTFDADYWVGVHMAMLNEQWPKLSKWEADVALPDGPYHAAAHLYFDSMEDMGETMASPGAAVVMGDVPNYTNVSPVVVMHEVAATS